MPSILERYKRLDEEMKRSGFDYEKFELELWSEVFPSFRKKLVEWQKEKYPCFKNLSDSDIEVLLYRYLDTYRLGEIFLAD